MTRSGTHAPGDPGPGLTRSLADDVAGLQFAQLPPDIVERARLCVLDWVGVTLAARSEPVVDMLLAEMREAGGAPQASPIGQVGKLPVTSAAMVNACSAHALDYDDASTVLVGHVSAPLLAGLVAVAEREQASGAELLTAFAAGYELACKVAQLLGPGHYRRGHHTTSTVGSVSVAAACARLMGLDAKGIATAMAIASTRAAGLRAMFGTMLKPLQVGLATSHGVLAAQLARRGIAGRLDALEAPSGMLAVSGDGSATGVPAPRDGWHLRDNLFKFHASCLLGNAPSIAATRLRDEHAIAAADIRSLRLFLDPGVALTCDDRKPATGLAMKFSACASVALPLAGLDTGAVETYSDHNAADPGVVKLRDLVEITYTPQPNDTTCRLEIDLADGRRVCTAADAGASPGDLAELRRLLEAKFGKLAVPAIGPQRAAAIAAGLNEMETLPDLAFIGALAQADGRE